MSMCSSAGMAARVVQQLSDSVAVGDAFMPAGVWQCGCGCAHIQQLSDAVAVGEFFKSAAI